MKSTLVIITLALTAISLVGQDRTDSKLRVGLFANAGTSSLVQGMGMNMNMYRNVNSSSNTMYNYAGSWGGGISLTIPLQKRWSFVGNIGYMNSGANYGQMYTAYDSRYRFSSLDVWAMGQYNSQPKGQVKFTAVLGLTESTLLSATIILLELTKT